MLSASKCWLPVTVTEAITLSRHLDPDHAAGQFLLGQRDGDCGVAGLAVGVLQGFDGELDVTVGAARAGERGDAPVDLGRASSVLPST